MPFFKRIKARVPLMDRKFSRFEISVVSHPKDSGETVSQISPVSGGKYIVSSIGGWGLSSELEHPTQKIINIAR